MNPTVQLDGKKSTETEAPSPRRCQTENFRHFRVPSIGYYYAARMCSVETVLRCHTARTQSTCKRRARASMRVFIPSK